MCGIAGIFAYHYAANPVDRLELVRVRDHMAARGPDGKGEWYSQDGRIGLAHRRLAIIDLTAAGSQPMVSADGTLVVTFNGEIYNYRDLRRRLEAQGRIFQSNSDTEVLLHLYREKGSEMLHDLRGMFAFAIWDANRRSLFLGRDPFGIKPLYYADDGWTIRFASQVKALMASGRVSRDPEPAGWVGFFLFGSVPEPYTTHQEIRSLPAGTTIWVDGTGPHEPRPYFSVSAVYEKAELRAKSNNSSIVRDALIDSVRHHLTADVPVGAFLSGGVDSGALVGLMRDCGQADVQTVTLAFKEFSGTNENEAPSAELIASQYGTRHTTRVVTEREFREDLPCILDMMDQPTIDGLNTWFVSKAARELGLKVVISGLGGDELFGGYPSFRDLPLWTSVLRFASDIPMLGDLARHILTYGGATPKLASMLKYGGSYAGAYLLRRGLFMPWELDALVGRKTAKLGLQRLSPLKYIGTALKPEPISPFDKVSCLESSIYMRNQLLRDTDWASMAHSLEVRTPLVDATLFRCLVTESNRFHSKRALANSPSIPVPNGVSSRAKSGFGTPIRYWLEHDERLQGWKGIPSLAVPSCHWARRWAYEVTARFD
jgi:asparagine synthase (glutamine-hydrolysing)